MSKIELIIFISSRFEEFESVRLILKEELIKINMNPLIFEDYGAQDTSMEDANIDDVRRCHIFIGLYGLKYSIPTYKEFKEAIKSNKHCLFYLKKNNNGKEPELEMKNFIREIMQQNKIYKKFDNILELKKFVLEDVISEISKSFVKEKYTYSEILQKNIEQTIAACEEYQLFENFMNIHGKNTKIIQTSKTTDGLEIIIDKGLNDGLFENIEFYVNKGDRIISRIKVILIQEKMSKCVIVGEVPKDFEKFYSHYSIEVIKLTKQDFVNNVIWRKSK